MKLIIGSLNDWILSNFEFEFWNLGFIWNLGFEIWILYNINLDWKAKLIQLAYHE
jgi:hypothetical protein